MSRAAIAHLANCLALSILVGVARAEPDVREIRRAGDPGGTVLVAPPSAEIVRARTMEWVAQQVGPDKARLEEVARLWSFGDETPAPEGLFDLTIQSFARADGVTQEFVKACSLQQTSLLAPEAKLLDRADADRFYTANLSLFYGRYLAHRQMFEESLEILNRTPIAEVVDPASLLFFRAVCQHHLLWKTEGLATIDQLLKNTESVPVRYSTIAALMQFDLEALRDQSLDEVSRKMTDVERRLGLGRTGEKVQKKEEEIIVTLDELIKKIEDQQGGGGGGGGAGGNANRSSSPAQDSSVKGSTAPGKVDSKKFKNEKEWGDLPPRARAKAKEDLARKFPAHYKDAIEDFTKKAANRPAGTGK